MRNLPLFLAAAVFSLTAAAASPRFDISGFSVNGNTLLPAADIEAVLAPYKGANRDFASVQRALEALQAEYARRGFNLVRVALPEQELNHGVIRLEVVETRVGRVIVEGNKFFDTASIRRSVPALVEGQSPNVGRISASLAQANEGPARKTTLHFQSGREGEVDARLAVVDEKPWRVSLNADNTGSIETGRTQIGLVYQNANVWNRDHVAALQYTTTAEHPDRVNVYGVGYHIPFYGLGSSLDLYGSYSDVDSGTVLTGTFDLALTGRGTVAGARYNHSFAKVGSLQSAVILGFDYKEFKNRALLFEFDLGNSVTVHPISLGYGGTWKGASSDTGFTLTAVHNIPGGNNGGESDFIAARAGARASYNLVRYGLSHAHTLPADWQIRLVLSGQWSNDHLVPGEQFGAGGVASVRGFPNRIISGDSGYTGNAEVYTPNLCGSMGWMCRVLAFADGARVTRNDPFIGEFHHASIGSVGLGLRAAVTSHVTLQLDWGHIVDASFTDRRGDPRVNFRLSLSY